MGHNRLGSLPRTRKWKEVIQYLSHEGSVAEVADASLAAVQSGLQRVPSDMGFTLALTVIFKFIESARAKDQGSSFLKNGFPSLQDGTIFDLVSCLRQKIDLELNLSGVKSDVSEITQNSFSETLFKYLSYESTSLFESSWDTTLRSLRTVVSGAHFRNLMHEFYTVFTRRYLTYYLSRELSLHVGPGLRFQNISEHDEFNEAFGHYINQAVRIADDFTPGWFSKAQYEENLTHDSISRYAHIAFKKIMKEFSRK